MRHGFPSVDICGQVFAALDPEACRIAFPPWMQAVAEAPLGDMIAIDGERLRDTFDTISAEAAGRMGSARATTQGSWLGQITTEVRSNEITAIRKLLDVLALANRVVTLDAMGFQMPIAHAIYAEGDDYVLSLKGHQTRRHEGIRTFILDAQAYAFRSITHTTAEAVDGYHGRNEVRRARATDDLSRLADRRRYLGLRSVLRLDRERIVGTHSTREPQSFVSSLAPDAAIWPRFSASAGPLRTASTEFLMSPRTRTGPASAPAALPRTSESSTTSRSVSSCRAKPRHRGSRRHAWLRAGTRPLRQHGREAPDAIALRPRSRL